MAKLSVEVVTPERRILSSPADEAILPGGLGLFGVRPGHASFLTAMEPGPLTLKENGAVTQSYFIGGGFAEVLHDKVTVLADEAEPIASINVAEATRKLKTAQERLASMSTLSPGYDVEIAALRREAARLRAAGHPVAP